MSQYVPLDLSRWTDPVSGVYPLFLFEFSHAELGGEPLLVCSSNFARLADDEQGQPRWGVVSAGREYRWVPVGFTLPGESGDGAPTCRLTVARFDELVRLLRTVQTRFTVSMSMVWSDDVDTVAASYPRFKVLGFALGQGSVDLEIGTDMDDTEPFPGKSFTADLFGGVHR